MAVAMIGFRGQIGEAGVEVAKLLGLEGDDAAMSIRRLSQVLLSGKTGRLEAAWRGRESQERAFQCLETLAHIAQGVELYGNIVMVEGGDYQAYHKLWERLLGKEGGHEPEDRGYLGED